MQRHLWLSGSLSMLCCARGMWLLNTHKSKSAIQNRKHASIKPFLLQLGCFYWISYLLNLGCIIAVHIHLTFWFALITTLRRNMVKSAVLPLFLSLLFPHRPWNKISSTHVLPLSSYSIHGLHNNFPLTLWPQCLCSLSMFRSSGDILSTEQHEYSRLCSQLNSSVTRHYLWYGWFPNNATILTLRI